MEAGSFYLFLLFFSKMDALPNTLLFQILEKVSFKTLNRLCQQNVKLRQICQDDYFIKRNLKIYFSGLSKISTIRLLSFIGYQEGLIQFINENSFSKYDYDNALTYAARGGHEEIVNYLISLGADNFDGAMAYAARKGYSRIISQMIERGANNFSAAVVMAARSGDWNVFNDLLSLYFLQDLSDVNYKMLLVAAIDGENKKIINKVL